MSAYELVIFAPSILYKGFREVGRPNSYGEEPSTKDEHLRISSTTTHVEVKVQDAINVTFGQAEFLTTSKNKMQLIAVITVHLQQAGFTVTQAEGDADTKIVFSAIDESKKEKEAIVIGNNTDLLVVSGNYIYKLEKENIIHFPDTTLNVSNALFGALSKLETSIRVGLEYPLDIRGRIVAAVGVWEHLGLHKEQMKICSSHRGPWRISCPERDQPHLQFHPLLLCTYSTMAKKRKAKMNFRTRAPFGIAMKRFEAIGIHPNLDKTGSAKKKSDLGPGSYDPCEFICAYKTLNLSSWDRKKDVEEFSQNLGFRNPHILKERIFNKSLGGPGGYDISEEVYKKQCPAALQNVGFGRQKRFWNPIKQRNPPPGTYGKNIMEASTMGHKQFSKLPTFEYDGFIDRFKGKSPPWTKPPNLYTPNDPGSIRALLTKVVSKRGPYDCFTGPRDGSTIKNHFAPPAFKGPVNWFNVYPNELDIMLNHPRKKTYGRFLKDKRFGRATQRHMIGDPTQIYRNPKAPSPCSYNIERVEYTKENLYAFNNSVREARPPTRWVIHPGVGRYNPKYPTCAKPKQQSWVFKSKCGRTEYKAVEYNAF